MLSNQKPTVNPEEGGTQARYANWQPLPNKDTEVGENGAKKAIEEELDTTATTWYFFRW